MSDDGGGDYDYPSDGGGGSYGGGGGGGGDDYRPPRKNPPRKKEDGGGIWGILVVGFLVLALFASCQEDQETDTSSVDQPVVQEYDDPAPMEQWQQEVDRMERDLAPPPPVPAPEDW